MSVFNDNLEKGHLPASRIVYLGLKKPLLNPDYYFV